MPRIFNGGEIVLISLVAPVKANPCPIPVMIVATIKTSRDFNGSDITISIELKLLKINIIINFIGYIHNREFPGAIQKFCLKYQE